METRIELIRDDITTFSTDAKVSASNPSLIRKTLFPAKVLIVFMSGCLKYQENKGVHR